MENGGGDALAHSQLARLYKLGLLHQDAGEVENDPHAFLNRLPPASARFAPQDDHQSPRTSSFQSSGDHSSDGFKYSTDHAPFTRVRPYPLASMMDMTRPPPRFEMASRVPLSPLSMGSRPTLPPLPFETQYLQRNETLKDTDTLEMKKRWFSAWKRCVEAKWMLEKAQAVASRSLKRRVLQNWQGALYKTHLNNARCRQLRSWRMQRALRLWSAWAALHGRVTWFLTAQGRSYALLNRLRRERTWIRWKRFVKHSRKQEKKLGKALRWRRAQSLRLVWQHWRVLALRGRRRRRLYRVFMTALRDIQEQRKHCWAVAKELHDSHAQDRLSRLLKRWRWFNNQRQRDHQHTWHIRMIMTRGKFFALWHTTMQHTQLITKLRRRVQRRVWRDHLKAWCMATQASKLGRTSTLWHPEAIRARYLHVWKCWTHDKLRFRFATSVIHKKQKKQALRVMRSWTEEHARISRLCKAADAITRRRVLTLVWGGGLLAFYFKQKHERQLAMKVRAMSLASALQRWRFEWLVRHEWRSKKRLARKMAFSTAVRGVWNGWRQHIQWRQQHKQQIFEAARHDHYRLILRGLVALSKAVEQTSEWTKACRQIRIQQREAWKRRVFIVWSRHLRKLRVLCENFERFVARPEYVVSIWNPLRRRWRQWVTFTRLKIQERQRIQVYQLSWKQKVFGAWKKRAIVVTKERAHTRRHEEWILRTSFTQWKLHTNRARVRRSQLALAASSYRQIHCGKVLRAWSMFVRLRCRVQKRGDRLHALYCARQNLWWFSLWRRSFKLKRGIFALEQHRRHAWLRFCWDAWSQTHHDANRIKKKITYYHRVFGVYPSMSPIARLWSRWKKWTRLHIEIKQRHYRCELHQAGICLAAWKTFRLAKLALRHWHRFSIIASATHNDLGKRCRLIREKRHCRLVTSSFRMWVDVSKTCQRRYEKLLEQRHRILGDILIAQAKRVKSKRCCVRLWFQRWRRRQLVSVHFAMHWHRVRLLRTLFLSWWRQVVHGKQERLLNDARRSMGSLSINKPKPTKSSASTGSKRVTICSERKGNSAAPKSSPRARMVDPLPARRSYLQPSQRLPPKQSLRELTRRDTRDAIAQRAQESVEKYRNPTPHTYPVKRTSQTSESRSRRSTSQSNDELPLFDAGIRTTSAQPSTTPAKQPEIVTPSASPLEAGECDTLMTLESIASMDLYSPPAQTRSVIASRSAVDRGGESEGQGKSSRSAKPKRLESEPSLFTPSQSLVPQIRDTPTFVKRVEKPSSLGLRPGKAQADLVQLLEIPQHQAKPPASTFRSVLQGISAGNESRELPEVDVGAIVRLVINYYVTKAQHMASAGSEPPETWLQTWGFCLLRDLGLFENGYFLSAMERTIQHVNAASTGNEPRVALQLLLESFIEAHPARKASKYTDALSWLVQRHLVRRCGHAALVQNHSKPFWIRHELPFDVVIGLPKLIKVFKKYQKPLETFFTWRPEHSGVLPSKTDCHMDLATFLLLMKHCHVHPQLFDRRALEEAVGFAGASSYRGQEAGMNLPQFIEALVRCALNLQWMEERSHVARNAESFPDLVVVVKFLMLVFTMEGRGSMLTKRSQDLDVLVSFLQQQQHETSSEKLRRFQQLLRAEPPRVHERAEKKRHVAQSNIFRTFMSTRVDPQDMRRVATLAPSSVERGEATYEREQEPERYQDEAVYQDLRSPGDVYEQHPSHHRFSSSQRGERTRMKPQRDETTSHVEAEAMGPVNRRFFDAAAESERRDEANQRDSPAEYMRSRTAPLAEADEQEEKVRALTVSRGDERSGASVVASHTEEALSANSMQEATTNTKPSEFQAPSHFCLQPPMDRDAFLNEILSSITDVELLLLQADERRGTSLITSSSDPDNADDTLVELSSEPFSVAYPDRYALLTTGQLPSSSLGGYSPDDADIAEDIRVGDPVLDCLTFADRFSESPNWESHLTIADVAEHGIHAAFPASMHVLGQVHTGELDDLTHPQPATYHLRASDNEPAASPSQFLSWSSEREWLAALQATGDEVSR